MRRTALAATLLLAATACGTDAGTPVDTASGAAGDVPITSAAIAAVAVDHLPEDPSSMVATYTDNHAPKGYLGADFRYHADGESDGDPRELDLDVPVATMAELARDDRPHLMTTQAVVDAGEDLEGWGGGEVDPNTYDRVPSTDTAVAGAYIQFHGGYLDYHDLRPSPLKADFGDGAIGGRFEREDGRLTSTIGEGEIWGVGVRADEVVALRYSGFAVPGGEDDVVARSEWYLDRSLLNKTATFGLTTFRTMLDFDLNELQDEG